MPVYNAEKYIGKTLESVLSQSYSNFEVIIIDDCGRDNSMNIVRKYADERFKIIQNSRNSGISYSRNRGFAASSGKYIAILDNDDIAMPTRLEKQVDFLEKNEDIDVVGGRSIWIDENESVIRDVIPLPKNPDYIKTAFLFENMYNNSETLLRKSLVDTYNIIYRDGMQGMEDFRFWIECSKVGRFSNLEDVVLKRRMTQQNTTSQILRRNSDERMHVYWKLQEYSLQKSGFQLTRKEYDVIHKCIMEQPKAQMHDKYEITAFYYALKKVINQAECLQFAEGTQVRSYMKERFKKSL